MSAVRVLANVASGTDSQTVAVIESGSRPAPKGWFHKLPALMISTSVSLRREVRGRGADVSHRVSSTHPPRLRFVGFCRISRP
jgi:hypothetical protein